MPEPKDKKLYQRTKKYIYKKNPKHSAYRSGLLVQDLNRDNAIYVITSDIIEGKEVSYEIKLTKKKEQHLVTVHKHNATGAVSYNAARNILKHILAAYGSSVAKK